MEKIQKQDYIVDRKVTMVNTLKEDTGYPFNLKPDQIVRIIYFFGARKLGKKAAVNKHDQFSLLERNALKDIFEWFAFVVPDKRAFESAYKSLIIKFKEICVFLRTHPAYITTEIYQALRTAGYETIIKSVVLVVDKDRNIVPRLIGSNLKKKDMIPLGKMESMIWNIQNVALDKIQVILNAISPNDIKKATLGTKAKALRDIYSMLHMAKQGNKNPDRTLVNININNADPQDKLRQCSDYVAHNREDH